MVAAAMAVPAAAVATAAVEKSAQRDHGPTVVPRLTCTWCTAADQSVCRTRSCRTLDSGGGRQGRSGRRTPHTPSDGVEAS